jgi:hypothetical protein
MIVSQSPKKWLIKKVWYYLNCGSKKEVVTSSYEINRKIGGESYMDSTLLTQREVTALLGLNAKTILSYREKGILQPLGMTSSGMVIYDRTHVESIKARIRPLKAFQPRVPAE